MDLRPIDDGLFRVKRPEVPDRAWVTATLRHVRRRADVSQRELARLAGVPKSTVAAAEAGRSALSAGRLRQLVKAAGFALVLVDPDGRTVEQPRDPHGDQRDAGGRRYAAHLDVHLNAFGLWWGDFRGCLPPDVRRPDVCVELDRGRRDHRWRRGPHHVPRPVRRRLERWVREGREPPAA